MHVLSPSVTQKGCSDSKSVTFLGRGSQIFLICYGFVAGLSQLILYSQAILVREDTA